MNFEITATLSQDKSAVATLAGALTGGARSDVTFGSSDLTAGLVPITLQNNKSSLPGTGGMGTTIFYIGGGAMLLAAAVFLVVFGRSDARRKGGKRARKI